jgi:hippurate hydrolase
MDGLPVKEATGLSFASTAMVKRGEETLPSMHACGHDVHMSVWLGVAKLFASDKKSWSGTMVFLAQSAEETGQGAKAAIQSANFSKLPRPDYQLAIHSHAGLAAGTAGFCDGYALAAVDMMNITIYGRGGHGAAPEKCIDPILIASQFVSNVQSVVSRNLSSNDPAVITVGSFQGGTAPNVIPDKVELKLTIRTYNEESRKLVLERIRVIGDNLARAAGMGEDKLPKFELLDMSIPPVYNDVALGGKLRKIISELGGSDAVQMVKPVMIGEDFGFFRNAYEKETPSYLLWLGTIAPDRIKGDDQNNLPSLHSSQYYPDAEIAIPKGIGLVAGSLFKLLNEK